MILTQGVILRVYGDDPFDFNARTELIRRAERASINMEEVRELRFCALNITRNGFVNLGIPVSPSTT